jgi:hypothetical protein
MSKYEQMFQIFLMTSNKMDWTKVYCNKSFKKLITNHSAFKRKQKINFHKCLFLLLNEKK